MMVGRSSVSRRCTTPKPVPVRSWRSSTIASTSPDLTASTAAASSSTAPTTSTFSRVASASRSRSIKTLESSTISTRNKIRAPGLLDETIAERIGSDVRIGLEIHLFQYAAAIGAHRLHAEAQLACDLRDRAAGGELAEDLELALGQLQVDRLAVAAAVDLRDQQFRHRRADVAPACQDGVHGVGKFLRRALLAQVAVGPHSQHVDRVLAFGVTGKDQDAGVGEAGTHVTQDVQAATVRHPDVQYQQFPVVLAQAIERLLPGGGLADLADRPILAEELPQARPDHGVVVGDQDLGHTTALIRVPFNRICGRHDSLVSGLIHGGQMPVSWAKSG